MQTTQGATVTVAPGALPSDTPITVTLPTGGGVLSKAPTASKTSSTDITTSSIPLALTVAPGTLPSYHQAQMLAAQTPVKVVTTVSAANAQPQPLLDGQSGTVTVQVVDKDVVLDRDKRAIYRHPLFPLLNLLFDKCEQATQTPDCPSADSFAVDIQQFVHQQERDHKPFFSEDPDLDSLMVKAIQVLRIHLLELEKVNELCKDFCSRYITCLKGKLQSENLLRIEGSEFDMSPPTTPQPQPSVPVPQVVSSVAGNSLLIQPGIHQPAATMATLNQGQLVSGGTVYQMVQTPQGIVAQPVQIQTAPVQTAIPQSPIIHGSTPLSQIGVVAPATPASTPTGSVTSPFLLPATPTSPSDDEDRLGDKKSKRGVLPKSATSVMRSWLFQHIVHPYPTEDEKRQIAAQTNLTLLQVNNWFINARRRILQPMLDSSNPDQTKQKKSRPPSRPVQRFWPDKIANLQPQLSVPTETTSPDADQSGGQEAMPAETEAPSQPTLTTAVTSNTQIPHQIILQPFLTADGQIISTTTSTVSLAGLQGGQLSNVLGHVQQGRLLLQNGPETLQAQSTDISLKNDNS
ncbi:homeobox protein PKNOX1-like [Liolophura sinensis]|uniref:homeobox protein PKNOX1-like n=1 Tax=Liolophura sinensis TaxID=3198878 RepID=UPI003158620F